MATFIASNNGNGREWFMLTPLEWLTDFRIELVEGGGRISDSEIEELIEKNWKKCQKERESRNVFVEEAWPKTGYRWHQLDMEKKVLRMGVGPADWKSMQGTHYNPEFFELMLKRFNERSRVKLSRENMHVSPAFRGFIRPYLDGALSQCSAIRTKGGFPLGFRSSEVGVAENTWHVPGGYLPGIGEGIYKRAVPVIDGKPIVEKEVFTPDAESMRQNAIVNLYKESGRLLSPKETRVEYAGLIYELPNHAVQFVSIVDTPLERFGTNWEHEQGRMRHIPLEDIPSLLNNSTRLLKGSILPGAQCSLALAYLKEKGLERVVDFALIRR